MDVGGNDERDRVVNEGAVDSGLGQVFGDAEVEIETAVISISAAACQSGTSLGGN